MRGRGDMRASRTRRSATGSTRLGGSRTPRGRVRRRRIRNGGRRSPGCGARSASPRFPTEDGPRRMETVQCLDRQTGRQRAASGRGGDRGDPSGRDGGCRGCRRRRPSRGCSRISRRRRASGRTGTWREQERPCSPDTRKTSRRRRGGPGVLKYDRGGAQEPRWPRWYGLLKRYGEGAGKEWAKPTRALAATWLIGHGDRRRRNLGLQHSLRGEPFSVRLAPPYDVSSSVGVSALDRKLVIGVARQQRCSGVGPRQWLRQAVECGLDPEETLALARNVAGEMPEAVAAAGERAKTRDENRRQGAAGRRLERMIRYAKTRRRVLEEDLARMRTWSNDTATPRRRTGSGWPTSPPLARGQALCADLGGVRVPGRGER